MNFLSVCFGWCRRYWDYSLVGGTVLGLTCWGAWMLGSEDEDSPHLIRAELIVESPFNLPLAELDARIAQLEVRGRLLFDRVKAKRSRWGTSAADEVIYRQVADVMQPSKDLEEAMVYWRDQLETKHKAPVVYPGVEALFIKSIRFHRLQCIVNLLLGLDAVSTTSPTIEGYYTDFQGTELVIYRLNGKYKANIGDYCGLSPRARLAEVDGSLRGERMELKGIHYPQEEKWSGYFRFENGLVVIGHEGFGVEPSRYLVKLADLKRPDQSTKIDIHLGGGPTSPDTYAEYEKFLKEEVLWLSAARQGIYYPIDLLLSLGYIGTCYEVVRGPRDR